MNKSQLRQTLIQKRNAIGQRKEKEACIQEKLASFLQGKRKVAAYYPIQAEADVYQPGMYLPKCEAGHQMRFGREDIRPGRYGIPEPHGGWTAKEELEVILVPLCGFCGTDRLGYGGGYYDRFLADCPALTIGIAFDEQEADFVPEAHDIPLDLVITPTRIIRKPYNKREGR